MGREHPKREPFGSEIGGYWSGDQESPNLIQSLLPVRHIKPFSDRQSERSALSQMIILRSSGNRTYIVIDTVDRSAREPNSSPSRGDSIAHCSCYPLAILDVGPAEVRDGAFDNVFAADPRQASGDIAYKT
jgi:hypothetical protein